MQNSFFLYDRRAPWQDIEPSRWGAVIHDEDGSLGLGAGTALAADHPLMNDETCTDLVGTGRLCGARYGRIELDLGRTNLPPLTHFRSDGVQVTQAPLGARGHYQSVVSVNHSRYFYGYAFDADLLRSSRSLDVNFDFLMEGDTVTLELAGMPANASVVANGYSAASSFNALVLGPGAQFFKQGASIFLKMRANGNIPWYASDKVTIKW